MAILNINDNISLLNLSFVSIVIEYKNGNASGLNLCNGWVLW